MNAEIPQNLEGLVSREHALKKRIGQRNALVEKIHSLYGIQPESESEKIRQQSAAMVVEHIQHSVEETLVNLIRISATIDRIDKEAVETALNYEKEGASESHEFKKLKGTIERSTPSKSNEDLLARAQASMTEINQRPLRDPILERGLYLLDEQRQEAKTTPASDDVKKEDIRKKGTYDRKDYIVTLPDKVEIKINGSVRNKMIQAFIQAFNEKKALTAKELTILVCGDDEPKHIHSMHLTLGYLKLILEKESTWRINQPVTGSEIRQGVPAFYYLEKIQEPEEIISPPAPEQPEKREAVIPMRGFAVLKGLLFNPDFTPDEAIEILGTDKKSKPLTPWRAFWSVGNTLKGITSRISRNDANITADEREIYEGFRAVTTSTIDHDAWGEYMGMVRNWFGIKQDESGKQPAIEGEQEEIEVTPETLTKDEAILLASRILYFNGVEIKSRNGNLILKAEIDEITLESASRVRGQMTDKDYSSIGEAKKKEIREQALQKIKRIIEDDTLLESIYESQTSDDVQTLLCWLILENEHYAGELINFMDLPAGLVTSFDGHNLWVEGVQSQIIVNSETAVKLLAAREQKPTPPAVTTHIEDKTPEDTEDGDEADDIPVDAVDDAKDKGYKDKEPDLDKPIAHDVSTKERKLKRTDFLNRTQAARDAAANAVAQMKQAGGIRGAANYVAAAQSFSLNATTINAARQLGLVEGVRELSSLDIAGAIFYQQHPKLGLRNQDKKGLKELLEEELGKQTQGDK